MHVRVCRKHACVRAFLCTIQGILPKQSVTAGGRRKQRPEPSLTLERLQPYVCQGHLADRHGFKRFEVASEELGWVLAVRPVVRVVVAPGSAPACDRKRGLDRVQGGDVPAALV
jgi:hypothetical protein